jgi:hypothetical protein
MPPVIRPSSEAAHHRLRAITSLTLSTTVTEGAQLVATFRLPQFTLVTPSELLADHHFLWTILLRYSLAATLGSHSCTLWAPSSHSRHPCEHLGTSLWTISQWTYQGLPVSISCPLSVSITTQWDFLLGIKTRAFCEQLLLDSQPVNSLLNGPTLSQ